MPSLFGVDYGQPNSQPISSGMVFAIATQDRNHILRWLTKSPRISNYHDLERRFLFLKRIVAGADELTLQLFADLPSSPTAIRVLHGDVECLYDFLGISLTLVVDEICYLTTILKHQLRVLVNLAGFVRYFDILSVGV